MKNIDLYVEYERVNRMCEGTKVKPWKCVEFDKLRGLFLSKPSFDDLPENYKFSVAIIEDTPVFVGDTIYHKSCPDNGYTITETGYVHDSHEFVYDHKYFSSDDHWILKPPEKICYTITITGDEQHSYKFNDIERWKEVEKLLNQYTELLK